MSHNDAFRAGLKNVLNDPVLLREYVGALPDEQVFAILEAKLAGTPTEVIGDFLKKLPAATLERLTLIASVLDDHQRMVTMGPADRARYALTERPQTRDSDPLRHEVKALREWRDRHKHLEQAVHRAADNLSLCNTCCDDGSVNGIDDLKSAVEAMVGESKPTFLRVVFDGLPGHDGPHGPRLIEVETLDGKGAPKETYGPWQTRPDGTAYFEVGAL